MERFAHLEYACALRRPELRHVLEFGVHVGTSLRLLRDSVPIDVEVFGFDSFEGLPTDWRDANGRLVGPCARGWFSTEGQVPEVPGVTLFVGWFEDTIPGYLEIGEPIGLLHVDCDLYSSTRTVLDGVGQLLVPGSIVVCDEWFYNLDASCDDHEQRAFLEWAKRADRRYELVEYDAGPDELVDELSEQQIIRIL